MGGAGSIEGSEEVTNEERGEDELKLVASTCIVTAWDPVATGPRGWCSDRALLQRDVGRIDGQKEHPNQVGKGSDGMIQR